MTTVNQKIVTDKKGQEIVVSVEATTKLVITFQRTGVDDNPISVSATMTESGVDFKDGFPVDVSEFEQQVIIKTTTEILVSNVFGSKTN